MYCIRIIEETAILLDIFLGIRKLGSKSFHSVKSLYFSHHIDERTTRKTENHGGRRAIVPINNTNNVAKNRSTNINDIACHFTKLLLLLNNNLVAEANRQ